MVARPVGAVRPAWAAVACAAGVGRWARLAAAVRLARQGWQGRHGRREAYTAGWAARPQVFY